MINTYHCPQCSTLLHTTGTLSCDGVDCPVFQCDGCVITKPIFGEPFSIALTFCVAPSGATFDPVEQWPFV